MRLAFWLMDRYGVSEALVGDLFEESRQRSALWLWPQTIVAILRTIARDIRAHRLLGARAVITGAVVAQLSMPIREIVTPLIRGEWAWTSEQWLNNTLGFPVVPLPFLIVMSALSVITGWVVARLHRRHAMSMVSAYTGALLIFYLVGFINSLDRGLQAFGAQGLALNSVFPFIITPAFVLIGGLLDGTHPSPSRPT
jgi:hypothetical protein